MLQKTKYKECSLHHWLQQRTERIYHHVCVGKEVTFLAKLFEVTDLKLPFKANKYLEHNLRICTMKIDISQVVYTS